MSTWYHLGLVTAERRSRDQANRMLRHEVPRRTRRSSSRWLADFCHFSDFSPLPEQQQQQMTSLTVRLAVLKFTTKRHRTDKRHTDDTGPTPTTSEPKPQSSTTHDPSAPTPLSNLHRSFPTGKTGVGKKFDNNWYKPAECFSFLEKLEANSGDRTAVETNSGIRFGGTRNSGFGDRVKYKHKY